jgi:hypothetical protein
MALETGTYVSDLVATNPTAGDPVSQADDHLRLLKSTLQNTFPEATAPIYGLRAKTAQASTSGTSVDFTSIPSWVKRITVQFVSVSTNSSSPIVVQLGDSGGFETTGYAGSVMQLVSTATVSGTQYTSSGFYAVASTQASSVIVGTMTITLVDGTTWVASSVIGQTDSTQAQFGGGSKVLSATIDRVRITTVSGLATFDAGTVNILYE